MSLEAVSKPIAQNCGATPSQYSSIDMSLKEFKSRDTIRKLWWLHDSFWHATLVKEMGHEKANRINLEVSEKIFRMLTITMLRQGIIQRPNSIQELMHIFRTVWRNAFFDDRKTMEDVIPPVLLVMLDDRKEIPPRRQVTISAPSTATTSSKGASARKATKKKITASGSAVKKGGKKRNKKSAKARK